MKIITVSIPENSLIEREYKKYDYADSFRASFTGKQNELNIAKVGRTFFLSAPVWVRSLFIFRNKIAALAKLKIPKTEGNSRKKIERFQGKKGERIGLFRVFDNADNEIILGEDDKHLNFRVSLYLERSKKDITETNLTISTIVLFNNWAGAFYFFIVGPFHRCVVRTILKKMIMQLEFQNFK